MNSRVGIAIVALGVVTLTGPALRAQMTMQPTARPIVTAENEPWFLTGAPIVHAGITYYPAGPMVHFNANEMVRGGHFQGVPLYTRTTIEPYSLVFVPLSGGLMQPYERRRDGDLAGTTGSSAPSFPVVHPVEQSGLDYIPGVGMAAAPPLAYGVFIDRVEPGLGSGAADAPTVGMVGGEAVRPRGPLVSARRPEGVNGVYLEYGGGRYFADGPAVAFDAARFTRVGDYHGFPVFQQKGREKTVYVPATLGAEETLVPYRAR
jgi:hypothetical protein